MIEALRYVLRRALNGKPNDEADRIMAWAETATAEQLKRAIDKAKA